MTENPDIRSKVKYITQKHSPDIKMKIDHIISTETDTVEYMSLDDALIRTIDRTNKVVTIRDETFKVMDDRHIVATSK